MLYRLGNTIYAHARLVLIIAVLAAGVCGALGFGVFSRLLSNGFDDPASASSKVSSIEDQHFGGQPDIVFLIRARSGTVDQPDVTAAGSAIATRLQQDHRVRNVVSYWATHASSLRSRSGDSALVLANVIGGDKKSSDNSTSLLSDYANLDTPAATVRIGGSKGTAVGSQVTKDLGVAESIAGPLTLILLLFVFGNVVAALLPLLIGTVSIPASFFVLYLLTHVANVSIFAINLVTALGLGLGIDYSLLVVARFREELDRGQDVPEAIARTMATAGRTIMVSAAAVSAALAALLVFPMYFLRSFAYAGVTVTLLSAVSALTLLPALLAVLGTRVNAGRIFRSRAARPPVSTFWSNVARAVMRRPVLTAAPVVIILLILASPLLGVQFGTPDDRVLPSSNASHQVGDALRTDYAAQPVTIDALVRGTASTSELALYAQNLSRLPGVSAVDSSVGSFTDGQPSTSQPSTDLLAAPGVARVVVTTADDPASDAAQQLVKKVRAQSGPAGTSVLVGGSTAELVDSKSSIAARLPMAIGLIILTTFILLFLFTGSVVQPIRALACNALTLGASLGAMVWIFQDGHLQSALGFTPTPTNIAMPILLFCIAFGLSMDYELFVMSRIVELRAAGVPDAEAVASGLGRSGRLVSMLAALLAVGFFAFGTSKVSFIQFFGLGTGLAILLDATVVRGVLVPASMRLFGPASWYAPASFRSWQQHAGLRPHA